MSRQLPLVLRHRNREHSLSATSEHPVQVTIESGKDLRYIWGDRGRGCAVTLPALGGTAVVNPHTSEPLAGLTVEGQEILSNPVQYRSDIVRILVSQPTQATQLFRKQCETRVPKRTIGQETPKPTIHVCQNLGQLGGRAAASTNGSQLTGPRRQELLQAGGCDQPTFQ